MTKNSSKRKLIEATKTILLTSNSPNKITSREIAKKADINLSMINYYFGSKDNLLKITIDEILDEEFKKFKTSEELSSKENLKLLLVSFGQSVIRYHSISKLAVPYILLDEDINLPYKLIPYIERSFKDEPNIYLSKLLAYEITSFLQVVLYRLEDFSRYMSIDLNKKDDLEKFIDIYIENLLGGL